MAKIAAERDMFENIVRGLLADRSNALSEDEIKECAGTALYNYTKMGYTTEKSAAKAAIREYGIRI